MTEIAVNTPFDSGEIKDIACEEFRRRLDGLGPLQGAKEYASFEIGFNVNIRLWRTGDTALAKDTLAWGTVSQGQGETQNHPPADETITVLNSGFESGDPNKERQDRGMPLTVESSDGRGGKIRKRVVVKE